MIIIKIVFLMLGLQCEIRKWQIVAKFYVLIDNKVFFSNNFQICCNTVTWVGFGSGTLKTCSRIRIQNTVSHSGSTTRLNSNIDYVRGVEPEPYRVLLVQLEVALVLDLVGLRGGGPGGRGLLLPATKHTEEQDKIVLYFKETVQHGFRPSFFSSVEPALTTDQWVKIFSFFQFSLSYSNVLKSPQGINPS